jgi:hypothetical protein
MTDADRIAALEAELADVKERLAIAERLIRVDAGLARQLSESIALNSQLRRRIAELEAGNARPEQ